ncbi:MAG: PspA/IM30 family protein [Paenibacillus sp.]|uniref:Phage shock protein A (PspA) family protein n=1 Tax=Paenibacillus aquistagni TaxID=1852522 RepID=A0A1X7LTJ9_9BACL|nr:PspA/IM30 family protein [Paenibacillus aquistagni]MBR2569350.1 PspA/IM30 family protein [Paenibacillus sp.]SMG57155.1 phage shock protein A (PspA) family protein [Paenibacillus aquistagni]
MSGIFRRVRDITLASLNEHLDRAEDPIQLIDQFLMRTQQEINESERLYKQYVMHANQMKQQMNQAVELRDRREQQALIALKANEEYAAKLALQEKLMHEEKAQHYTELYNRTKDSILELEQQLHTLKGEFQTVYDKRQLYIARMQTIRLQQRMNERTNHFGGNQTDGMFRRLDDRVTDMEWETQSLNNIRHMNQNIQGSYEKEAQLQQEMQRLREKLNTPKE